LPNVGKSTLFNALTNAGAESANYPVCTIEPNVGVVPVPDERLNFLSNLYNSEKIVPATIEFVDIAGLVKGASKGEGLGNKFLSHIREVDAIIHVVRCFENDDIVHVEGIVDPIRDVETINLELIFSDMEILERRLDRTKKLYKGDKSLESEIQLLEKVLAVLNDGLSARTIAFTEAELEIMREIPLLSMKPIIYVANISEEDLQRPLEENGAYMKLKAYAEREHSEIIPICASIEAELAELSPEEREVFLSDLGIEKRGLNILIEKSYSLLGLISYLTAGPTESRAWTIKKGTRAPQAAGKIHSDFERGFIRAEVIAFDDLKAVGNMAAAREKGLVRSEGKDYVVKDGDVVLFRFNV